MEKEENQKTIITDLEKEVEAKEKINNNPQNQNDDEKEEIKEISTEDKINELLTRFMCFLISKRRFFYIEKILKVFLETCSKKRGEIKAELTAAKNMSKDEINNVKNDLVKSFDSKINLNFKSDPSLIGVLIIQVGSIMVDTSIKNKLKKIEKQMIEA